jgi:hypothetical protein
MSEPLTGRFRVGKSFERDGTMLESGMTVVVDGWRNADKLLRYRYLVPLSGGETVLAPSPSPAGEALLVGDDPRVTKTGKVAARRSGRVAESE